MVGFKPFFILEEYGFGCDRNRRKGPRKVLSKETDIKSTEGEEVP